RAGCRIARPLETLIVNAPHAEERSMDDGELRRQLERSHADAFGWALACCRRKREDAEDVLHTVYLGVLDGRLRFDRRSSRRTWLFGVIRRTASAQRRIAWLRWGLLARNGARLLPPDPVAADARVERRDHP